MAVDECLRLKVLRGELERGAYAILRGYAREAALRGADAARAWDEAVERFAAEASPELRERVLEARRKGEEAALDKALCAVASEAARVAERLKKRKPARETPKDAGPRRRRKRRARA